MSEATCPICGAPLKFKSVEVGSRSYFVVLECENGHEINADVIKYHARDVITGEWDNNSLRTMVYMLLKYDGNYYILSFRSHTLSDLDKDITELEPDELELLDRESARIEKLEAANDYEAVELFEEFIGYTG